MDPETKRLIELARRYGQAARAAFLKKEYVEGAAQALKQDETIAELNAYLEGTKT